MDTPFTFDYADQPLGAILEDLQKKVPGIFFHAPTGDHFNNRMSLKGQYPLRGALELIEDACSFGMKVRFTFVVRDYGLLFCPEDKVPPGALRLQTFITGQYIPIEQFQPRSIQWRSPVIENTPAKEEKGQDGQKK